MPLPQRVPVHQYHCAQTNGDGWRFLFSTNPSEGNGWTYDNIAWYAYPEARTVDGFATMPIYQYHFVQANGDGWRYRLSPIAVVDPGWILDGVAFYAFVTALPNSLPIYQYYCNQASGDGQRYTYATSPNMGYGWTYYGPAFYCPPAPGSESLGPTIDNSNNNNESTDQPPEGPGNSSSSSPGSGDGNDEDAEEEEW